MIKILFISFILFVVNIQEPLSYLSPEGEGEKSMAVQAQDFMSLAMS